MHLITFIYLIIVYSYVGFSLKLIDQINDEDYELNVVAKNIILYSSAILAGIGMAIDIYSASIGLTLIFGLLFTKKINVLDFKIYAIVVSSVMFITSIFNFFYVFLNLYSIIITMILLIIGIIADELLNNYLDTLSIENPFFKNLTSIRPLLKILVFVLPLVGLFTFYHAFIIILFDISYDVCKVITEKQMKNKGNPIE